MRGTAASPDALQDWPIADIVAFLGAIGIPVAACALTEPTFLPGILVERGTLRVDPARLAHPGDLLHEAGHLAMMTPACRAAACGDAGQDQGAEIGAELWSYAALTHLGLPPETVFHETVFHEAGYKGAARWLIDTFSAGSYPGLPLLQWMGLTLDPANAAARGVPAFPHMLRWLREA